MRGSGIAAAYARQLRKRFAMWPAWPPTNEVRVGDFGRLEKGLFQRQGSLGDCAAAARASHPRADQLFTGTGVRHAVLAAAGTVPEGRVGARIEFGRKLSVFLALRGCREWQLSDPLATAAQLAEMREEERWPDDYCLVTAVLTARSALVAVSAEAGGSLELSAAAPATDILACLDAELQVSHESGLGYRAAVNSGCTPLFTLSRLGSHGELQFRGESHNVLPRLLQLDPEVN